MKNWYKQLSNLLFILILGFAGSGCELLDPVPLQNPTNNLSDDVKISSIKFSLRHLTSSEEWVYLPGEMVVIASFRNVDSIRFASNLRSQKYPEECIVELYDFTNKWPVPNSTVASKVRFYFEYVESPDIYANFPREKVLLGIRMRSSKDGNFVEVAYDSEIIIYSH